MPPLLGVVMTARVNAEYLKTAFVVSALYGMCPRTGDALQSFLVR